MIEIPMEYKSLDKILNLQIALPEEIEEIAVSQGNHLLPEIQRAFKDKVERYICKQDRDVIIARIQDRSVGYCMVINQLRPPDSLLPEIQHRLSAYGCITGLGVNPEWRENRIGVRLVKEGLDWALHRGLPGLWLRTRVMSDWYVRHFQFERVGSMMVKETVKKAILAKTF